MEKETNLKQKDQRLIYVFNRKDSTVNKIKMRKKMLVVRNKKKERRKKRRKKEKKKYNYEVIWIKIVFNCLSIVYFLWFQSYIYFI